MMQIGGKEYLKRDIHARCGNMAQIGGYKRYEMSEGYERSTEIIEINSGAGLKCLVCASKGLDIVGAEYCGTNLVWSAPNRYIHPAYYQPDGTGWLHTYSSGLLTTCGFSNVGSPCTDEGVSYGIHGKAHNTPAAEVTATTEWIDDECYVVVSGLVQEHEMFGADIVLRRRITVKLGCNEIKVEDRVENRGFERVPVMLLYHCNFGFPLLAEQTEIIMPSKTVEGREPDLEVAPALWRKPTAGIEEQVYFHSDLSVENGLAQASLINPEFPLGGKKVRLQLDMSWDVTNLPELIEWYMPGCSTHALGIEPANCRVMGRKNEKEAGRLKYFEPGEEKEYLLLFSLVSS